MSKKLILLIIIFVAALGALGYVYFFYVTEETIQIKSPPKLIPFNNSHTASLSFLPSPLVATSSANTSLAIILDTKSHPTIIQLEIGFNPGYIYNLSITPGSYFINPEIPLEKTDFKNGRMSYALTGEEINPNSNIVAVLNFTPVNYGVQKITEFEFLPKTSIKENSMVIKLLNMESAAVTIKPSFFIPFATPSAVLQQ